MAAKASSRGRAKLAEAVDLIGMSKLELIAHGQRGGQAQVDAGLEMFRRAVKRQEKRQA